MELPIPVIKTDSATADHTYAARFIAPTRQSHVFLSESIPKTHNDAISGPHRECWIEAMNHEFDSHKEKETLFLVYHPGKLKNMVNSKWIYSVKFTPDGEEYAKARLVANGADDSNDYEDQFIYTPVCPIDTIRLILSFAVAYNYSCATVDVFTAFLYGALQQEVYLRILRDWTLIPKSTHLDLINLSTG